MKIVKFVSICLLFLMVFAFTSCPSVNDGPVTLFSETFEGGFDNLWNESTLYATSFDALTGLTGGTPSGEGSYAFSQYNENANSGNLFVDSNYYLLDDITPSYIRFYIRAGQIDKMGGYVGFWGPEPYPATVWFYMGSNDYFIANNQIVLNQEVYNADTWYKVELKDIDFTNHIYDVYIDDVLVLGDRAMSGTPTGFGAIALYNWDAASQFYYDDILIQ